VVANDWTILILLILLLATLVVVALLHLNQRDEEQNRRNRWLSCGQHDWKKDNGIRCQRCGGTPMLDHNERTSSV